MADAVALCDVAAEGTREAAEPPRARAATQADIDRLLG